MLVLAVVAMLAFVAAGCGGDEEAAPPAPPAEEPAGEPPAEEPAAGGEGSIWVLLPDSASSPRWETDDRRYFEEAFTAAGVDTSRSSTPRATRQRSSRRPSRRSPRARA